MKLYSFSKNSWHVRFFKWLFDVNPVHRYKTMCPYFWTYVLIFLFLPFILLVKLFGKSGTKFLNWVKDFKENRDKKSVAYLNKLCSNPNLTNEEAYKIRRSRCWKKHNWDITWELREHIDEMFHKHLEYRRELENIADREREAKIQERSAKYEEIKELKWFPYVAYTITFGLLGIVAFAIIYGGYQGAMAIDWPWLGKWTLYVLGGAAILFVAGLIVYAIIKYLIVPFVRWVSCMKLPHCGLCENFKAFFSLFKYVWRPIRYILVGIIKFFAIIGDMIYSTYKKKCPIITWEDK